MSARARAAPDRAVGVEAAAGAVHPPADRVYLHARDLVPRDQLSNGTSPVAARAAHLRRVLATRGFGPQPGPLEVSPRSTVQALFGRRARGYKRDADPWNTRAPDRPRLATRCASPPQPDVEGGGPNDHCFNPAVSYTAFLWGARWQVPPDAVDFASHASSGSRPHRAEAAVRSRRPGGVDRGDPAG
jgi:hypothetical protein